LFPGSISPQLLVSVNPLPLMPIARIAKATGLALVRVTGIVLDVPS
jgi:hypothetical protein